MKSFNRLTCLILIGVCITTALPILAAIGLAREQAAQNERQYVAGLAQSALTSADNTGDQLASAARAMKHLTPATACTPEGLDLMRRIDLRSTMLQAVGWIDGDVMRCSSFGGDRAFALGAPDLTSTRNRSFWLNLHLVDPDDKYLAIQTGNSVGIVHRELTLSFVDEVPGLKVAIFNWSQRKPIVTRGTVAPDYYAAGFAGDAVFRRGGNLVAVVKSKRYDIAAIAVLPAGYGSNYVSQAAMILIPLGVIVGLILSGLLIHVVRHRASMLMMIRSALRRGQFYLLYQPVIDLESGRTIGVEALLRWDRGSAGPIPPERFIAAAEEAGLIPLITARVLELLAEDADDILRIAPQFHFAVNFAAADMHRTNILEEVNRLIESTGIAFASLVIEATEQSLVDIERASETMQQLRAAGIKVAIDDFGTGYSSLAYLAQLEVDFLKIDKLFVQSLGTGSATSQVAARIIEMAKDLDLEIIAEGIETVQQERLVRRLGVGSAQGFLYGRPMPVEELLQRLRAERRAIAPRPRRKAA